MPHPAAADFPMFTVLWNQQQNQSTPALHLKMAHWLEEGYRQGDKNLLLMAFRSAGKSTMVGLFAAWLLYCNPDLRILVLAADHMLAKKMVRNVKRIIERHPLTGHLRPKDIDQWAGERFTISRPSELRDPSMLARGISANITGSRADIIICDDVEVPNTCDSPEKRANLRERLLEIPYILIAGGTQLYVGTPHDYYSIYADIPRSEIGEERPFLDGFKRLSIPITNEQGQSVWPEKYPPEIIAQMKIDTGPNKFESQMLLKPVNIMEGRLNPDLLKIYDEEFVYDPFVKEVFIGNQKMLSASAWWDPSFASAKGDSSVLAVIFADQFGDYYLQHIEYIRINSLDEMNEATQQCRIVAQIAKQFYLPSLRVEMNGIGRFLPGVLKNVLKDMNVPTRVRERNNTKNKALRILEGFDAIMAAGRLKVHKNVCLTPFIMEMREWRPGVGKDDGLDAVAGALSLEPDRIASAYPKGSYDWQQGKKPHKAKSDWDV